MGQNRANELHSELYRPSPSSKVMTIQPSPKRKMDACDTWAITFTEQDMEGVDFLHNDALVLSISIQRKMVRRVLVDQGSSAEILYYLAFKALGFTKDQLSPVDAPLVCFTGIPVYSIGKIVLPVFAARYSWMWSLLWLFRRAPTMPMLGRNRMHDMKTVTSTLHQCVRFIGESGRQGPSREIKWPPKVLC